tara:strand:- start:575 stop:1018 length:444 start_codon:yes stop_codon:yes gene_type:complete
MNKIFLLLATGFGIGYSKIMPGTVGSLIGLPIAYFFLQISLILQIILSIFFIIFAIIISDKSSKIMSKKDPSCIVIDEYLTIPITIIGLSHPLYIFSGFIFHRIFDIIKPSFISKSQKLPGGLGIVIDDVLSALIALILNYIIYLSL